MGLLDKCQQLAYTTSMDKTLDKTHTAIIQKYFSNLGKLSASTLTPQERKDRATKAAIARWAKVKSASQVKVRGDVSTLPTASIALPTASIALPTVSIISPSRFASLSFTKCTICDVRENKHQGLEFDTYHKNHGDWHPFSRAS